MRALILKRKKIIVIVLVLCIYFSLLTLISFVRASGEGMAIGESLVENEDFEVEAEEGCAWVDAQGLHFNDSKGKAKVFSSKIVLCDLQRIAVSFHVYCPAEFIGTATLHVDLCAAGYDTEEQEFVVELTAGHNEITQIIDKGSNAPTEAQFRIFCLDTVQCDISDLRVQMFTEVAHKGEMACAAVIVTLLVLLILTVKIIADGKIKKSESIPRPEESQIETVHRNIKNERQFPEIACVFVLYALGVCVYFFLQAFPKQLAVYPDELIYYGIARSFAEQGRFSYHNTASSFTNILYSLLIAPFFHIRDVNTRMVVLELFNCVVMTSAIFPAYLMARECLQQRKTRIAVLLIVIALPDLMLTGTFMSEVIFYPLALWAVFIAWELIAQKQLKMSFICAFAAGVVLFFLYWSKAVALALLLSLTFILCAQVVLERSSLRRNIFKLLVLFGMFLLTKWVIDNLVFNSIVGSSYVVTKPLNWFLDPYNLLYMLYSVVYNGLAMLLAFFIFPVIVPMINFREMPREMKEKYTFVFLSIAINILVISYLISSDADLGQESIRVHLRYYSLLLVPILIIFFWHLENFHAFNLKGITNKKVCLVSLIVFLCTLYITVFQGVGFSIVDCALLNFYSHSISIGGKVLEAGAGQIIFNCRILATKIGICIAIIAGSTYLYKMRRGKIAVYVFSAVFLLVNYTNSSSISTLYNQLYRISNEQYEEALALGEYIDQHDGNTLVIAHGQQGILDKYLPSDVDFIDWSYIADWRIDQMEQYTFIITDKSNYLLTNSEMKEIPISDVEDFAIYQNFGLSTIYYYNKNIFPTTAGELREVPVNDDLFFTQCIIQEDGTFVSTPETSGALVYGPYCDIQAGTYRVNFYYETNNLSKNDQIGSIDVNIPELGGVLTAVPVEANNSAASIEFTTSSNASDAEVRFFANTPGISVYKLEIQRLT